MECSDVLSRGEVVKWILRRIQANVIDMFIYLLMVGLVYVFDYESLLDEFTLVYLFVFIPSVFYKGQTIGKRIMKLEIVNLDGMGSPSWKRLLFRLGVYYIIFSVNPCLGFILDLLMIMEWSQSFSDLLSGTVVVRLDYR